MLTPTSPTSINPHMSDEATKDARSLKLPTKAQFQTPAGAPMSPAGGIRFKNPQLTARPSARPAVGKVQFQNRAPVGNVTPQQQVQRAWANRQPAATTQPAAQPAPQPTPAAQPAPQPTPASTPAAAASTAAVAPTPATVPFASSGSGWGRGIGALSLGAGAIGLANQAPKHINSWADGKIQDATQKAIDTASTNLSSNLGGMSWWDKISMILSMLFNRGGEGALKERLQSLLAAPKTGVKAASFSTELTPQSVMESLFEPENGEPSVRVKRACSEQEFIDAVAASVRANHQ